MPEHDDMHIHEIIFLQYVHPPHEKKRTKLFRGEDFDKLYEKPNGGIVAVKGDKLSTYPPHVVWQVNYHPNVVEKKVPEPVPTKPERVKKPRPLPFSEGSVDTDLSVDVE